MGNFPEVLMSFNPLGYIYIQLHQLVFMIRENRQLVTDEPVEFEK